MRYISRLASAAMLCAVSAGVVADEKNEIPVMLCAVTYTVSCDSVGDCVNGSAAAVNLPVFMQFDSTAKTVETAKGIGDEHRTSAISSVIVKDDAVILLGDDAGSGWSVTINKSNGDMSGAIATDGMGFLIFGSCLAR